MIDQAQSVRQFHDGYLGVREVLEFAESDEHMSLRFKFPVST